MSVSREWRAAVIAIAIVALGVALLRVGFAPFDRTAAWLAALAGLIIGAIGLLAWLRDPSTYVGPLLVLAAFAWIVGLLGLVIDPWGLLAPFAPAAIAWAILAQATLTYPSGRVDSRVAAILVVAAYGSLALAPPEGPMCLTAVVITGLVVARLGGRGHPPRIASGAGAILVLGMIAAATPQESGLLADRRIAADVSMAMVAIVLASGVVAEATRRRRVLDLVVEAGAAEGDREIGRRLTTLLGEPGLKIGYWRADERRFADPDGLEVRTSEDSSVAATVLEVAGEPVALVLHAPGRLADPGTRQAMARASALLVANARLQREVAARADEVDASRGRLILAADDESRQLRRELEERVDPRLAELERAVSAAAGDAAGATTIGGGPLAEARAAREEIAAIVNGLPPRDLDGLGLAATLEDLARRSPLPARIAATCDGPNDPPARAALFFTCSEGLTNAARHARATGVDVRLACSDDTVTLEVIDDGVGGADLASGTGLLGIRDRLYAVGGTLGIESPPGGGTRLVATVPTSLVRATA